MKPKLYTMAVALLLGVGLLMLPVPPVSAADTTDDKANPIPNCAAQVAKLNYRSSLLSAYRKNEQQNYLSFRKLWASRIAYAGQWVPKDAEKARAGLYKYDALHTTSLREVNKQIKAYKSLQKTPLDCAKTDADTLKAKLSEMKGWKDKKAVSGNALVEQNKRRELDFRNKELTKLTDTMIDKLHAEKRKNPKPLHTKLDVKQI